MKNCPSCGVLMNEWTKNWQLAQLQTVCGMCAASNKIQQESQFVSKDSVWSETGGVGSGYYHRRVGVFTDRKWEHISWTVIPVDARPKDRNNLEKQLAKLNEEFAGKHEYAAVQCKTCHAFHNLNDWVGGTCFDCQSEGEEMVCTKCLKYVTKFYNVNGPGLCQYCYAVKHQSVIAKAKQAGVNPVTSKGGMALVVNLNAPMQNGDVRKLPKANSPMWTDQWACQGSAKAPYVVSRRSGGHPFNPGNNTTEDGWACSCPDFTRHTPRSECKHIIRVQKKEGLLTVVSKVGTGIPASQAAAFEKFLRQEKHKKLASGNDSDVKMTAFDSTGRKFR